MTRIILIATFVLSQVLAANYIQLPLYRANANFWSSTAIQGNYMYVVNMTVG